jgi:AraC-like DNA-binding protein
MSDSLSYRLVYESKDLRIPGVRCLGQYHYATSKPGLPPHAHRGCLEISFLIRGFQFYRIGGKVYRVKGGDQYLALPDEVHDTAGEPEEKGVMYWLILEVVREAKEFLFLSEPAASRLIKALCQIPTRHFHAHVESRSVLEKAFAALARRAGFFDRIEVANHLTAYLLQTLAASRAGAPKLSDLVQASLDFTAQHEKEWITVARLAEQASMSESHFKARFRSEVGLPPAEYMLRHKIDAAKARLGQKEASLTDIAYDLGFSSSQHFSTVFKRYTRITPSEYMNGKRPPLLTMKGPPGALYVENAPTGVQPDCEWKAASRAKRAGPGSPWLRYPQPVKTEARDVV